MEIKKTLLKYLLLPFIVGLFFSCSTKKNTTVSRSYHNLTSRYNTYFNGNASFQEAMKLIEDERDDNYIKQLSVFLYNSNDENTYSIEANMQRAIDKASLAIKFHSITAKPKYKRGSVISQKDRQFREKKEFVEWIDDSYLLIGKANYFRNKLDSASQAFYYITNQFPNEPSKFEALLWIARIDVEQKDFIASKRILDILDAEKKLPPDIEYLLHKTYTFLYIERRDYPLAIERLNKIIANTKNKKTRLRFVYLQAQLYEKLGDKESAYQQYLLASKSPDYKMTLYARFKLTTILDDDENDNRLKKMFLKMSKNKRNKSFLDQIYFGLGNLEYKEKNYEGAIAYYNKSNKENKKKEFLKGEVHYRLGKVYFEQKKYELSKLNYDSASLFIDKEYPDYSVILETSKVLNRLIKNIKFIDEQDNLKRIALLPPTEQKKELDELVKEKIKKDEEKKKLKEIKVKKIKKTQSKNSSWYFNNPQAIKLGKKQFITIWGERKLEDDWRRSNKSAINFDFNDNELTQDTTTENISTAQIKMYNTKKDELTSQLPLTEEALVATNQKIKESFINIGNIYKDNIGDNQNALANFEELEQRSKQDKDEYLLVAYYNLYLLHRDFNNTSKAGYYKGLLNTEYPKSQYTRLINNPNFFTELENNNIESEKKYQETYNFFLNNYSKTVISNANQFTEKNPLHQLSTKFMLLKALSFAKLGNTEEFKLGLQDLLASNPDKNTHEYAKNLLGRLKKGESPYASSLNREEGSPLLTKKWDDKSLKKERKKEEKKKENLYKYTPIEKHSFIIIFPKGKIDQNRLIFNLAEFNITKFIAWDLDIKRKVFESAKYMITIEGFENKLMALNYYNTMKEDTSVFKTLKNIEHKYTIISKSNFKVLYKKKALEAYKKFFHQFYLAYKEPEKKIETPIEEIDVKAVEINVEYKEVTNSPTESFEKKYTHGINKKHLFILVVPKKNVFDTKSMAALKTTVKNLNVQKQLLDDNELIVVENILNKSEAIKKFKTIIENRAIYTSIEHLNYKNFIISKTNFEILLKEKDFSEYLDFFEKAYLNK